MSRKGLLCILMLAGAGCAASGAGQPDATATAPEDALPIPWLVLLPKEDPGGPVFHEDRISRSPLERDFTFGIDVYSILGLGPAQKKSRKRPSAPSPEPPDLRHEEIRALTQKARLEPLNPWIYESRGRLRADVGEIELARLDFARARVLQEQRMLQDPDDEPVRPD